MPTEAMWWAVGAGLLASLACGLGVLPLLVPSWDPNKHQGMGHAVAAGLMTAASVVNLLFPAVTMDGDPGFALGETLWVIGGLLAGAAFLTVVETKVHGSDDTPKLADGGATETATGTDSGLAASKRLGLLVFLAMTFHSIPEGVAVGTAFASDAAQAAFASGGQAAKDAGLAAMGMADLGPAVALAIGIHNMPEGLAVAIPMRAAGVSMHRCFWAAVLTSLPQPLAALPAVWLAWLFQPLMPFLMAFAAGAMLLLVVWELVPEALSRTSPAKVAWGFVLGFCAMLLVQVVL